MSATIREIIKDHKLAKQVARFCPNTYRAFFGRKYMLPNYRQPDYTSQDLENALCFDRCCTFAAGADDPNDEVWHICLGNTVAALKYNRPTLFLERELGEALMRTAMLEDLTTGDINWRWPALRVYLPKGLVTIRREEDPEERWITYFDVAQVGDENPTKCPGAIAAEMDQFVADYVSQGGRINGHRLLRTDFKYKEAGMTIGCALNKADTSMIVQTIYGEVKPWGSIKISEYAAIAEDLKSGYAQDDTDRALLRRLEHLVINVLLFLSAMPAEYEPFHVLRSASLNPSKPMGELVKARFVGDARARVQRVLDDSQPRRPVQPTGRHLPAHWVSGHWRRVVHGTGRSERRIQWIQPYNTTDDVRALHSR